jgi:hypothetical protein
LGSRVVGREEALAASQPSHPLLTLGDSPASLGSTGEENETAVEGTVDIFGTLSIAEDGATVHHGATSMSEVWVSYILYSGGCAVQSLAQYLVQKSASGDADSSAPPDGQPDLLNNLQLLSVLYPFPPHSVTFVTYFNEFLLFIPSAREAFDITHRYWLHFSMGFVCLFFDSRPLLRCRSIGSAPSRNALICRHQFMKQIYDTFYPFHETKVHLERSDSHRLGVSFITLALGYSRTQANQRKPRLIISLRAPCESIVALLHHDAPDSRVTPRLCLDPICDNTTAFGLFAVGDCSTGARRRYPIGNPSSLRVSEGN